MGAATDLFDLRALGLSAGEGRRFSLEVALDPLELAGERYEPRPARVPARLDVARMTGGGHSLRLRFAAGVEGPCMRCLGPAAPSAEIDAREVDQPGETEDLDSPYLDDGVLDLRSWARDALLLALPTQVLCREHCAGLCPVCAADLNLAGPEHAHEREPDPRWAKLRELRLE